MRDDDVDDSQVLDNDVDPGGHGHEHDDVLEDDTILGFFELDWEQVAFGDRLDPSRFLLWHRGTHEATGGTVNAGLCKGRLSPTQDYNVTGMLSLESSDGHEYTGASCCYVSGGRVLCAQLNDLFFVPLNQSLPEGPTQVQRQGEGQALTGWTTGGPTQARTDQDGLLLAD